MLKQYKIKDYKFRLIIWLMAVCFLGVLVIGSAKEDLQNKQFYGLILGLIVMVSLSLIDFSWVLNFYWLIYIVNIIMLISVTIFGKNAGGATRWIEIGGFRFQPSELSKILLILFFAKFIMVHEEDLSTFKTLLKTIILMLIPLLLIFKQPDLSTSLIIFSLFCVLIYIGGLKYKIIGGIIVVSIPLIILFFTLIFQSNQQFLSDYRVGRIKTFFQPEQNQEKDAQQDNSKTAIASGQLYGKGLNNQEVYSVKNSNFIPEPQTDFIFAVVGEELGFIGSCVVIVLLFLVTMECIWIGKRAKDLSGTLIACGMAALIGIQSFVNIGVATRLLPNTGVPLPFVSYGLTSLVSLFIGMGIVLNIGLQSRKY